jgi:hypothetical protein
MRVAEITTRIIRVIEVPRSQLGEFIKTPEAQQVGVYFLLGELSEVGLPRVYIGQSGSVGTRLVQHNQSKDFWNRVMVVISLTNFRAADECAGFSGREERAVLLQELGRRWRGRVHDRRLCGAQRVTRAGGKRGIYSGHIE